MIKYLSRVHTVNCKGIAILIEAKHMCMSIYICIHTHIHTRVRLCVCV